MNTLIETLKYFFIITLELTVLYLGISTLISLLLVYVPQEKLKKWMSRRGITGYFLGAVMGSLTPFCACSTIPLTVGMLKAGTPFGPVISFIIASPLLNPVIISMVWILMGINACIIYFCVTFLGSILFGLILERLGWDRYVKNVRINGYSPKNRIGDDSLQQIFIFRLKGALSSSWKEFRTILPFLILGVFVGSVIYGFVPGDFVVKIAGPEKPLAIPIAAIIGIPLYIRAETVIPIGVALSQKGMSIGAVIALIIGGAGMAIPEMAMLAAIFKKRLVGGIVLVIWLTAVLGGYFFNALV